MWKTKDQKFDILKRRYFHKKNFLTSKSLNSLQKLTRKSGKNASKFEFWNVRFANEKRQQNVNEVKALPSYDDDDEKSESLKK